MNSESDSQSARVTVELEIQAPGTLHKSLGNSKSKLLVTMISDRKDTILDVITPAGSLLSRDPDTYLPTTGTSSKLVFALYELPPNRAWKITAILQDARDSLRQADSMKVVGLKPFEYRTVSLSLQEKFTPFNALFSLPAEIQSRAIDGSIVTRSIHFTRLSMLDGDVIKCDSMLPGIPAAKGLRNASVLLTDPYATKSTRRYTLNAYGYLEGDTVGVTAPRLLFQGVQNVNASLAKEAAPVALEWKAANVALVANEEGKSPMVVKLGPVGTVVLNVRISGEIDI